MVSAPLLGKLHRLLVLTMSTRFSLRRTHFWLFNEPSGLQDSTIATLELDQNCLLLEDKSIKLEKEH